MRRKNLMVHVFRALSGETQRDFARRTGVHPGLLARYERDQVEPSPDHLQALAQGAGLTVEDGEQILQLADILRQPRRRAGQGIEDLHEELSQRVSRVYWRLLRLPLPDDLWGPQR